MDHRLPATSEMARAFSELFVNRRAYRVHPVLGWMNARIQSWFPLPIQICRNGREWLAQQMEAAGLEYVRQHNCFPWIEDWARAHRLMDRQGKTDWPRLLHGMARQLNPMHQAMFARYSIRYYWATYQSEWATNVVFGQAAALRRLYARLLHHGVTTLGSTDVVRFLGRRVLLSGEVPKRFTGEVIRDLKQGEEEVGIKHSLNGNAGKLYDKACNRRG